MVDAKPSKENKHEVDIKLVKQPKVEEQRNFDANLVDEPPKVVAPKVDFRIELTTKRKFDHREQMLSWVRDLAVKLGFIAVIAKSDNGGNGRKGYVTLGCQRGSEYREYIHEEREEKTTL
ncbi:FAR1-related protein, partial [Trifolium medium]|nr:FAR1-related protein [Trifolium medium]